MGLGLSKRKDSEASINSAISDPSKLVTPRNRKRKVNLHRSQKRLLQRGMSYESIGDLVNNSMNEVNPKREYTNSENGSYYDEDSCSLSAQSYLFESNYQNKVYDET